MGKRGGVLKRKSVREMEIEGKGLNLAMLRGTTLMMLTAMTLMTLMEMPLMMLRAERPPPGAAMAARAPRGSLPAKLKPRPAAGSAGSRVR